MGEAIENANGMQMGEKKVFVAPWESRSERENKLIETYTNVYVKNFPESWDEEMLRGYFEGCQIKQASVQRDEQGKSKGFAFVTFKDTSEAQKAVKEFHGKVIVDGDERFEFYVARAQRKKERRRLMNEKWNKVQSVQGQDRNLYIKNIDSSVDDDELRKMFEPYGDIQSAKISKTQNGDSKGFGFVCLSTIAEAKEAIKNMDGRLQPSGKALSVDFAKKYRGKQTPNRWPAYPTYSGFFQGYYNSGYAYTPDRRYNSSNNRWKDNRRNSSKRSEPKQKQLLGEQLFPRIQKIDMQQAGKITGMILEMPAKEIRRLVEDSEGTLLKAKVVEAQQVLKNATSG